MNDSKNTDLPDLEAFFEAGRATPPAPSEALLARVLADSNRLQPKTASQGWRGWSRLLGGLPGLGGLAAACGFGLWLGLNPPAGLPDFAGLLLGQEAALGLSEEEGGLDGFGWDLGESLDG